MTFFSRMKCSCADNRRLEKPFSICAVHSCSCGGMASAEVPSGKLIHFQLQHSKVRCQWLQLSYLWLPFCLLYLPECWCVGAGAQSTCICILENEKYTLLSVVKGVKYVEVACIDLLCQQLVKKRILAIIVQVRLLLERLGQISQLCSQIRLRRFQEILSILNIRGFGVIYS